MQYYSSKKPTVQNNSSVQEVSKQDAPIGRLSPTHLDHWKARVFLPTYRRNGRVHETANYSCKIQFAGRRESFPLHTANNVEAAQKARDIYLDVVRKGWDEALKIHKPKPVVAPTVLTVGEFFRLVALLCLFTESTLATYKTKLRTLIAFSAGLGSGRAKGVRHIEWREKVDSQPLSIITPKALEGFERHILSRGTENSVRLHQTKVTFDGYIRNMRSLFREEVRTKLAGIGVDLAPQPFDKIKMLVKGRSAYAYVSTIQAEVLLTAAVDELSVQNPDAFTIIVLALLLGLRRGEIDGFRWDMMNWERKHIALEGHDTLRLKTATSRAQVPVEPELLNLLWQYKEVARGEFVVQSKNPARKTKYYRHYRCENLFKFVNNWLRDHGVTAIKPLHTLRKEYGSLVVEKFGLVAAKSALRHASVEITMTYYVQDRREANTGLGMLLPKKRPL